MYKELFPNHYIIITIIEDDFYRNFSQISSLPYFTNQISGPLQASTELLMFSLDIIRSKIRFNSNKNYSKINNNNNFDNFEIEATTNFLLSFYKNEKIIIEILKLFGLQL